ncbi:HNH endonuclease [Plantactinospora sp. S1510]|uniref:HNH endonuclease n=1 Tax=Plantactinospora alkalitolerans TaxID=2789879 RepID=A0ABS0H9Z3_9ACTN|nr:HNH endonuclease [Plantactinospora alkalitolerans]MBF9135296.1 HNH endonuclease [Plantactinospora alkalitolerans]
MPTRLGRTPWEGSNRRGRLPDDWAWRCRETFRVHGTICHWCNAPGADEIDHVKRGDDHRLENLRPIHSWRTPQRCHVAKTAIEANAARVPLHRPKGKHPGLM